MEAQLPVPWVAAEGAEVVAAGTAKDILRLHRERRILLRSDKETEIPAVSGH